MLIERSKEVCFQCGRLFARTDSEPITCPDCKASWPRLDYDSVIAYAARATRYGYSYRRHYEAKGLNEDCKPCLPLSEALTFCGIAALSGIIGNAAHGAVMAALRRILAQVDKDDEPDIGMQELEHDFETFIFCIRQYVEGTTHPAELRTLLIEEERVDIISAVTANYAEYLLSTPSELRPSIEETSSTLKTMVTEALARAAEQSPPHRELLVGLWTAVPKESFTPDHICPPTRDTPPSPPS